MLVVESQIKEAHIQIEDYKKIIKAKENDILIHEETRSLLKESLEEIEPYEISEIENEIENAKKNNEKFALVKDIKEKTKQLTKYTQEGAILKNILNKIKEYKEDAMENTIFPIDNLDIRAGKIYYNNHPLEKASGTEQLLVATAIAASEIPKDGLQALFILDPPQIDTKAWRFLEEFAEKRKIQLWISKVEEKQEQSHIFLVEGIQQKKE